LQPPDEDEKMCSIEDLDRLVQFEDAKNFFMNDKYPLEIENCVVIVSYIETKLIKRLIKKY